MHLTGESQWYGEGAPIEKGATILLTDTKKVRRFRAPITFSVIFGPTQWYGDGRGGPKVPRKGIIYRKTQWQHVFTKPCMCT